MTSSLMQESLVNESGKEERSEVSSVPDDAIGVHVYARMSRDTPPVPARTTASTQTGGHLKKARAPSPSNQDTGVDGDRDVEARLSDDIPPSLPPRAPLRKCSSPQCERRPVLQPRCNCLELRPPEVPSKSCMVGPQRADILRSRPPPPRPDQMPDISHSLTVKPIHLDHVSIDHDLVWWSPEERSTPSNQVLELTHWPIPMLSSLVSTEIPNTHSRKMNEYVDNPVALCPSTRTSLSGLQTSDISSVSQGVQPSITPHLWPVPQLPRSVPSNKTKKSDSHKPETTAEATTTATTERCRQSILCSQCGECRCKQCTEMKQLPEVWLGDRQCSAKVAVECCTCMCCARALFYHCRAEEDRDYSDDPCACTEQRDCCKRWTALSLLSLCLPCLCLYWPLAGALHLCTMCYNRSRSRGCRCQSRNPTDASKGLLLDSESSSSS